MAAVFPETVVKLPNGNYKAYYRDADEKVTTQEITSEDLAKMVAFGYERFGHAPNIKVIG